MVLRGNACDAKWLWRDHRMPASEADEQCAKTAAVTGNTSRRISSIARPWPNQEKIESMRKEKGRGGSRARKQAELDLLLKAITPKDLDGRRENKEGRSRLLGQPKGESRGSGSHDAKVLRRQNAREQTELRRKRRNVAPQTGVGRRRLRRGGRGSGRCSRPAAAARVDRDAQISRRVERVSGGCGT